MSSVIKCPNCKTPLFVPQDMVGQVMACPTCQRPIQFVAPGAPPAPPGPPSGGAARPPALPKAAPIAAPLALEPAPAAPKYSAEVSQLALRPAMSAPASQPHNDSIGLVTILTWAVVGCLIVGSGIVVVIVSASRPQPEIVAGGPTIEKPPPPPDEKPSEKSKAEPSRVTKPLASAPAMPRPTPSAPRLPPVPTDLRKYQSPQAASPPAPVSTPVEPPAPARQAPPSIFDGLEDAWRLPALISKVAEPMGMLASEPSEPLNVSLSSLAAAIPVQSAIYAEKAEEPATWTVMYVADLQSPDKKTPLATLRLVGRQFSFAWDTLDSPDLRRQVANCRLEVHHGDQRKAVQLRAVQQEMACKLDLEKDMQVRELPVADLPKVDLLRLEITGLDGFMGEPRAAVESLTLGKETKIEFKDPPGAEIGVTFRKQPSGSLIVRLEPVFREAGAKEFEMTLKRLDAMEDGVSRALQVAERDLPRKQKEVRALRSALSKAQNNRPSNPLLVPAWQTEISNLDKDLGRAANRVETLQQQIPMQKARLEAVPKMREFLTAMHQKASIRMRVIAECGEHDLVLVDATKVDPNGAANPLGGE